MLAESGHTCDTYGFGVPSTGQVFRFNLHGSLQKAGLDVGQFIGIRAELDGETVQGTSRDEPFPS